MGNSNSDSFTPHENDNPNFLREWWNNLNRIWVARDEMEKFLEKNPLSPKIQQKLYNFASNFTVDAIFLSDFQDLDEKEKLRLLLKSMPTVFAWLDSNTKRNILDLVHVFVMKR